MHQLGDALRVIHALGPDHPYLREALAALGIDWRPVEEPVREPRGLEPLRPEHITPLVGLSTERALWHFPLLLVEEISKQPVTSGQPILSAIRASEPLESAAVDRPTLPPATPLFPVAAVRNCLHRHLREPRQSRQLDIKRLTERIARKQALEVLPWLGANRLPSETWLYLDLQQEGAMLAADYRALYFVLQTQLGQLGIARTVELLNRKADRFAWRDSHRFDLEEAYGIEQGVLPMPPVGSCCLVVVSRSKLQCGYWQDLHAMLSERQVRTLYIPLDVNAAAARIDHLSAAAAYSAARERVLAALSLTPQFISLPMVRDLRLALTHIGPELELDLLQGHGINWSHYWETGEWKQGFAEYQQTFRSILGDKTGRKAHEIIDRHIPKALESVRREHQLLVLAYTDILTAAEKVDWKQALNDYYGKAARWVADRDSAEDVARVGWWLSQARRLGDAALKMPVAARRCFTLAKLIWERHTGQRVELPVLDPHLWSEYLQQSGAQPQPGLLLDTGKHIRIEDAGAGGHQGGRVIAQLDDAKHFQAPAHARPGGTLDYPTRALTLTTLREALQLRTLSSRDLYWAQSVSVTDRSVVAEAEGIRVAWPADGERQGPVIELLKDAEDWLRRYPPRLDHYGLYVELDIAGVAYRLRYIPPGSFLMGSPPQEPERFDNELQHAVTLSRGFWLGATTITQALWLAVMGDNPSHFQSDATLPVDSVSWNDGQAFFARVERLLPGLALTFPSEAQWEYACRAGSQTPFASGTQLTTGQANYDGNFPYAGGEKGVYREKTVAVDAFAANAWGLYQMHGNLWEWCLDDMREYRAQPQADPLGDTRGPERALRGGSWFSNAPGTAARPTAASSSVTCASTPLACGLPGRTRQQETLQPAASGLKRSQAGERRKGWFSTWVGKG